MPYHTISRRTFCKAAGVAPFVARSARAQQIPGTIDGVNFGVETFSYHDLPPAGDPQLIPTIIRNMRTNTIPECEIMSGHVEPWASVATGWWVQSRRAGGFQDMREAARHWRLTVP